MSKDIFEHTTTLGSVRHASEINPQIGRYTRDLTGFNVVEKYLPLFNKTYTSRFVKLADKVLNM